MTPAELQLFLQLTAAIDQHKRDLDAAIKAKQDLARRLYERYGRHAVYRIEHKGKVLDLVISRSTRNNYFFAPRIRYPSEARFAKAEKKRLDRAARMAAFPTQATSIRPPPRERPTVKSLALTQTKIDHNMERENERSTPPQAPPIARYDPNKVRLPIVGDVDRPPPPVRAHGLLGDQRTKRRLLIGDV